MGIRKLLASLFSRSSNKSERKKRASDGISPKTATSGNPSVSSATSVTPSNTSSSTIDNNTSSTTLSHVITHPICNISRSTSMAAAATNAALDKTCDIASKSSLSPEPEQFSTSSTTTVKAPVQNTTTSTNRPTVMPIERNPEKKPPVASAASPKSSVSKSQKDSDVSIVSFNDMGLERITALPSNSLSPPPALHGEHHSHHGSSHDHGSGFSGNGSNTHHGSSHGHGSGFTDGHDSTSHHRFGHDTGFSGHDDSTSHHVSHHDSSPYNDSFSYSCDSGDCWN